MKRLYMDESGECSFSSQSSCKHFVITIIGIDDAENELLKIRLKRRFSKFISRGWPKGKEIKANELFRDIKFGADAITQVLNTLTSIPSLEISYLIVNKQKITNQSFRNASYGIGYNYFSGVLLSEMVFQDGLHNICLICDKRNKETHAKKHFREYLETKIFGDALEGSINVNMTIDSLESHQCYGLLAVDYYSWAIYRKFEHGDDRFFNLFQSKLKRRREWYI